VVASTGPGAVGQSIIGHNDPAADSDLLGDDSAETAADASNPLSWARYVTGVDQAIETLRRDADKRLLEEQQPKNAEKPAASLLEEEIKARPIDSPTPLEPTVTQLDHDSDPELDQCEAVDAAIAAWSGDIEVSQPSHDSTSASTTVPARPASVHRPVELTPRRNPFVGLDDAPSKRLELGSTAAALLAIAATAGSLTAKRSKRSLPRLVATSSPAHDASSKLGRETRPNPRHW
jgi:hypothetical protein